VGLRSAKQVSASELARRDRLGKVAASPNSKFDADGSITLFEVGTRSQCFRRHLIFVFP
jgi:hypothetical protein